MLIIENVFKRYRGVQALDGLSLTLGEGRTCLLLGPNGAGKTTLMKLIAGLCRPDSGKITLDGSPVSAATRARVAYMPTESYFFGYMTVRDTGRFYRDFFPDFSPERFHTLLERMELRPEAAARSLSSGQNARLRLALTLSRDARLMMFDEPLNGVDILTRAQVISALAECRAEGRTMLISTHLADELDEITDDAAFLSAGRLLAGGDRKTLAPEGTLTELYLKLYSGEEVPHA